MKIYAHTYILFLMLVFYTSCGQNKTDPPKDNIKAETQNVSTSRGPHSIVRAIKQDRKGNIWMAAFDGVFKYDGKSFTNITSKASSARFFSVLEDRNGRMWLGSIGSGVYEYDGRTLPARQAGFPNLTTKEGLAGNSVNCIYEDKTGNIWLATGNGVSRYDGKSLPAGQAGFRNFTTKDGLPDNDINAIMEDKTGKFWFGTGGNACVYDARLPDGQGKKFTILTHEGKPFTNIRSIIEDKKGNVWLGGKDGLWRYDGHTFANFTTNFVGCVYEDREGNIWTGSENRYSRSDSLSAPLTFRAHPLDNCTLSRYDGKSLSNKTPTITEIKPKAGMIAAILEANDGSIWFGGSDGVYRYDGKTVTGFNGKERQK